MATNYPGSLDTSTQQPSPSASTEMDDSGFEHDAVHTNHSGAIIALETKVGTGDSNAVANSVLAGTGSGTSGWTTTPTVTGLTVNGDTSSTGHFTAQSGGADGGIVLGQTYGSSYVGLRTAGMGEASADEYVIMSNGTHTFVSGGSTGNVYIRAGANSTSCQIILDTDQDDIDITGDVAITGGLTATGNVTIDGDLTGTSNTNFFVKNDSGEEILFQESSNSLYFKTNGTYRAYFTSGGDFVPYASATYDIGTSSLKWQHAYLNFVHVDEVRGSDGSASDAVFTFTSDGDTGMYRYTTNQAALTGGGTVCLIAAAGTVNTAGLTTSSLSGYQYVVRNTTFGTLYRYTSSADTKENITNVTASDAASWIDALQPVTFNERWLQEGTESDEDRAWREADIQVGFVADDVLANSTTAKFAQVEDVDGTLKGVGWKWECVIAAAVAEIKSLRTRVADLEAA